MIKIYYILIALLAFIFVLPGRVSAQGMMNFDTTGTEAGQNLSDNEYEKLGEQRNAFITDDYHLAFIYHIFVSRCSLVLEESQQIIGGDMYVRLL